MLSQAFPEWFGRQVAEDARQQEGEGGAGTESEAPLERGSATSPPHIASVLHFLRLAFSTPEIIDDVPLASAANPSAWHAWRSHRAKFLGEQRAQSPAKLGGGGEAASSEGIVSPRAAQPGGARRPGEWNWSGVWEDRVRKVVAASRSDGTLFGGEGGEVVSLIISLASIRERVALRWVLIC